MTLDRERWLQLAQANAEVIRVDIERLRSLITDATHVNYVEFWAQSREISFKFKTFKPMEVEEREALWADFRSTCEATRALQDSERAHHAEVSKAKRKEVEALIAEASALAEAATTPEEIARAQSALSKTLDAMKTRPRHPRDHEHAGEAEAPPKDEQDVPMLRSDREACWSKWVRIRDGLKAKRNGVRKEHLAEVKGRAQQLAEASETEDPRTVQERIREAQSELKASGLTLAEQEAVRLVLRAAWKRASERIQTLRDERKKQHTEWLARMIEHLSRWETQILKDKVLAAQIQGEIAELEEQAAKEGDAERSGRTRRWIDGKRARLTQIEILSGELQEKINSVRSKMGKEAPAPITELSEEEMAAVTARAAQPRPERPPREASAKGPRRVTQGRDETVRVKETPHPGLNLGEVLAKRLGLVPDEPKAAS